MQNQMEEKMQNDMAIRIKSGCIAGDEKFQLPQLYNWPLLGFGVGPVTFFSTGEFLAATVDMVDMAMLQATLHFRLDQHWSFMESIP